MKTSAKISDIGPDILAEYLVFKLIYLVQALMGYRTLTGWLATRWLGQTVAKQQLIITPPCYGKKKKK